MPKIKPLFLFIITSIALHWWALSLPIFQRIKSLEKTSSLNTSPTIIAKLSTNQPTLEPSKKSDSVTSNKEKLEAENQSQLLPPPSLLRGSPWLRRPPENRSRNSGGQPLMAVFTQIEIALQGETAESSSNFQCKRSGLDRLFTCKGFINLQESEKIAQLLNQMENTSGMPVPSCIAIEAIEKKWHARACHS